MKRNLTLLFLILILSNCAVKKINPELVPIHSSDAYEEDFDEKFVPEAYHPVDFDVGHEECDLEQKRKELEKLKNYNLISEEEFNTKANQL